MKPCDLDLLTWAAQQAAIWHALPKRDEGEVALDKRVALRYQQALPLCWQEAIG